MDYLVFQGTHLSDLAMDGNSTSTINDQLGIDVCDTQLTLLANRMAWWQEEQVLLLADTHFGKAATFRQHGMPVPSGTTSAMLDTISAAIDTYKPKTLIVLGDLIHSSVRAMADYQDELKSWREVHSLLDIQLVRGNHDRHNRQFIQSLDIASVDEGVEIGPFRLVHNSDGVGLTESSRFTLSGHIHPCVRLPDRATSVRLPCFWQRANEMVFPAFGEFTGCALIKPFPQDCVYVTTGESIFRFRGQSCK